MLSTPVSITDLREIEYELRIHVDHLRRDVYAQADPAANVELLSELVEAEDALAQAESRRADAQESDTGSGLIMNTSNVSSTRGLETTGLDVKVYFAMSHVPTAIYHLFDSAERALITCEVRATRTNNQDDRATRWRRIRVTSFIEGYSARAVNSFEIPLNQSYTFRQLPTLFPERVREVNELTRATVHVLVENLDGKTEYEETAPIWLLARTSAPFAIMDPKTGKWQDISPYYGAFVTPNATNLMTFLRVAAAAHPLGRLMGYQGDLKSDGQIVTSQVKALYDALKETGKITYVNSLIDFNPEQGTASQRVRLPRESLSDKEANCIDGTVLFASLLEAISLHPAIVLVPGHAFLGWEMWTGTGEWRFLETTMIGTSTFEVACKSAELTYAAYKAKGQVRLWPLKELRVKHKITPME